MDFIFISYLPGIIGLCLLALVTYLNGPKLLQNRLFVFFTVTVAIWLAVLLLADSANSDDSALLFLRTAMSVGTLLGPSFLFLADVFPTPKLRKIRNTWVLIIAVVTALFMGVSFTDLMSTGVERSEYSTTLQSVTFLYTLQTVFIVGQVITGVVLIWKRRKNATITQKSQIRLFSLGVLAALAINIFPNFLFILFNIDNRFTALLTSSSFLVFSVFVWVAITRYDLFNVRSVVARAVAYTVSTFVVVAIYALISIALIDGQVGSRAAQISLMCISLFVLINVFNPLKKTFNHLANSLFYREAYSSREKLSRLTDYLVSHIDLDILAKGSLDLIIQTLRPQFGSLFVQTSSGSKKYGSAIGTNVADIDQIMSQSSDNLVESILSTERADEESAIKLRKANIELIIPMRSVNILEGYIVLGPRQSGEVYSKQDVEFLSISARNIGLAINNAKSYQEIAAFNDTLKDKIQKATRELRTKNNELEALHKTKDDFISMASHQLRPKIAASEGFLDLLHRTHLKTTPEQSDLLRLTKEGIQRMSDIVISMLDISRMDAKKMQLDFSLEPVEIASLVKEEITALTGHDKEGRFVLDDKRKSTTPLTHIDTVKIREVINNLLSNADQYSPKNTPITAVIREGAKRVEVLVVDKGIGMTKEEQESLFRKFYRSEEAKSIRPNGSGIGLYMTRKVIEAHGGKMIVKSEKGKGSSIGFSIPYK